MFDAKKLNEEHEDIVRSLKNLADVWDTEKRVATADEEKQADAWIARKAEIETEIKTAERSAQIQAMSYSGSATPSQPNIVRKQHTPVTEIQAFKAWCGVAQGRGDIVRSEWKQAAYDLGHDLHAPSFIFRTPSVGMTNPGNTYVSSVYTGLEKQLKYFGGIASVCKQTNTSHGRSLVSGYIDDTANVAAARANGLAEVSNTAAVFSSRTIDVHGVGSGIFYVDAWELENSEEDLSSLLQELLGERIARKVNLHTTVGSLTNDRGFMVDAPEAGEIDFEAPESIYDSLVDLYKSIDIAYRNMPGVYWYMTDLTHGELMKVRDPDSGERVWSPDPVNGDGVGRILGKPILICNEMEDVSDGEGAKVIAFGHAGSYEMRSVRQVEIKTFREATVGEVNLALTNNIGFGAFYRFGGKLLNTTALKHLAVAAAGS